MNRDLPQSGRPESAGAVASEAEEVARLVGALYAENIAFLTGETIYIDGGQGANH